MILFRRSEASVVNPLLEAWGHYLGEQDGPRLVAWYALWFNWQPVAVAVSGSPRGARCAGIPWRATCELIRICAAPEHRDMTRVALRCWRKVAAQDFADAFGNDVYQYAAYSDSSRHPGNIYRFDGWSLIDERRRGSGGTGTRGGSAQAVAKKKLWVFVVEPVARPATQQGSLLA